MAYKLREYAESDAVQQARDMLAQQQAAKPGEFSSQWTTKVQDAANKINNRGQFQYNLNNDPLYNQYKQQYMRQGKTAMMDTMGQAAAMNGGYGSSYGQMAGQQAYNGQIQQLNDRIPELYNLAMSKWQMEGQDLMDRFNAMGAMEGKDYDRYQDQVANWQNDRDYAANRFDTERNHDYTVFSDSVNQEWNVSQQEQQLAIQQVDWYISQGKEPPAELIEAAGYDPNYVNDKWKAVKKKKKAQAAARAAAAAGGGGKKTKSGSKPMVHGALLGYNTLKR